MLTYMALILSTWAALAIAYKVTDIFEKKAKQKKLKREMQFIEVDNGDNIHEMFELSTGGANNGRSSVTSDTSTANLGTQRSSSTLSRRRVKFSEDQDDPNS